MKQISPPSRGLDRFWEVLFQLTFVSPSPASFALLCSLLSKLLALAQPLTLLIYDPADSSFSDITSVFIPMTYFDSGDQVCTFAYAFFSVVQICLCVAAAEAFFLARGKLATESSILLQLLHGFLAASAKVLAPVAVSAAAFLLSRIVGTGAYSPYKHLDAIASAEGSSQVYVAAGLMGLTAAEIIAVGAFFLMFCQDRGMRRRSFWSADTDWHVLAELTFTIYSQTEFFFEISNRLAYIVRTIMTSMVLLSLCLYTRYSHYLVDLSEFFFAVLLASLSALVAALELLEQPFTAYARYPVLLLLSSALLCIVRAHTDWRARIEPPENEAAALESVRWMSAVAMGRDPKSLYTLFKMLGMHAQRCCDLGCECHKAIRSLVSSRGEGDRLLQRQQAIPQNTQVYLSEKDLPANGQQQQGLVSVAFRCLVRELASASFHGEALDILMAEIEFYLFKNHYAALCQLELIAGRKPRLETQQRAYNLRRTISAGLDLWASEEESAQTLAAMEYLRYYQRFLDRVEDATESTIKFWSTVRQDEPSASDLNGLGKLLFRSKYKVMKTVEKISRIASNHLEFLVRYGLFMRFVMHDLITSEQVFLKISFLNSALSAAAVSDDFSIFRRDAHVMLIAARLDHAGAGTVTETNTAVEHVLGYSRRDLLGASLTVLMSPVVAQKHNELVARFFQTMQASNLGIQRAHYIKAKDGAYVLCRCMIRVVPRLTTTNVELVLFAIADRKHVCYTAFRREPTEKCTGAILCMPGAYTIIGFTREVLQMLRMSEERAKELAGTAALTEIFPWLSKTETAKELLANEGRVFAYQGAPMLGNGTGSCDVIEDENVVSAQSLLWGRFVAETAGGTVAFMSLVLSEIAQADQKNYLPNEGTVFYVDAKVKEVISTRRPAWRDSAEDAVTNDEEIRTNGKKHHEPRELVISDVASVASMASVGSSMRTSSAQASAGNSYEMSQELQLAAITRQTPTTIKWLGAGMLAMLIVVVALIFVSVYVSVKEVGSLETRFQLIEQYHLRYKASMVLADMARSYSSYIGSGISKINSYVDIRTDALSKYNVATRKLLFGQDLDYDGEMVYATDISGSLMSVTFSHTVIMYSSNNDAALSVCKKSTTSSICQTVIKTSNFAFNLAFYPIRNQQASVSRRLDNELTSLSRQGETTQYVITGLCMVLILASAAAILPIFVWVIRDKSRVLEIFADITPEESDKIIEGSRSLDIKNLRYKRRWIQSAEERHEAFWKKLVTQHRRGFGKALYGEDDSSAKPKVEKKADSKHEKETAGKEKSAEEEKREGERLEKRRGKLGETDYALRRMFVVRLVCVMVLFFMYSGFALYFNAYVHDRSSEASTMLFALCKRSVYPHLLNFILVQAFNLNNTAMAGSNPDSSGELYTTDVANEMFTIEAECQEFRKSGSGWIYGDYFDLVDKAEGSLFCNISDSGSDIAIDSSSSCFNLYKGPQSNGLYAGIQYYLDLHIKAAQVFVATNFSSTTSVTAMKAANSSVSQNVAPTLTYPLSFVLGKVMVAFYECAMQFFSTIRTIVYASSIGFIALFVGVYVLVFARFIGVLNEEIWHTRGMVNMIPIEILARNKRVREQVWHRRGMN